MKIKKHGSFESLSLSEEEFDTISATTTTTTTLTVEAATKTQLLENSTVPSFKPPPNENGHSRAEPKRKMAETWPEMLRVCSFYQKFYSKIQVR